MLTSLKGFVHNTDIRQQCNLQQDFFWSGCIQTKMHASTPEPNNAWIERTRDTRFKKLIYPLCLDSTKITSILKARERLDNGEKKIVDIKRLTTSNSPSSISSFLAQLMSSYKVPFEIRRNQGPMLINLFFLLMISS